MQYLLLILFLCPYIAYGVINDQKNKMITDLDIIKNTFEIKYAPAEWKKHYANWDLNEQIALAKQKIMNASEVTVNDYQRIVKDFFNSTQDYHVDVRFISTEIAMLPFGVKGVNGRYFVSWMSSLNQKMSNDFEEKDLESLENYFPPFSIGDEIISFDGKPIDQIVQEIKNKDFGSTGSETEQLLAEYSLTIRLGSKAEVVPQGPIAITTRAKDTEETMTFQMQWMYVPERIQNHVEVPFYSKKTNTQRFSQEEFFYKQRYIPLFDDYQKANVNLKMHYPHLFRHPFTSVDAESDDDDEERSLLGSKKSPLPPLGEIVWEVQKKSFFSFYTYIFKLPSGQEIAYIRIPSYIGDSEESKQFEKLIRFFQERTDGLVIDQLDNPGGRDLYMYSLASYLTDYSLELFTEQLTITQKDVYTAHRFLKKFNDMDLEEFEEFFGEEILGYEVTPQFLFGLEEYFKFIINEWNEKRFLTRPVYPYGVHYLKPHSRVNYTKPILILVNGLDFSCGDYFPAIMQDNHRATIFGSKTAGAGGLVLSEDYYNRFGIESYNFTGSIAWRLDQNPIENLGISPDISYQITERDLQENYVDYVKAVQEALIKIVPARPKEEPQDETSSASKAIDDILPEAKQMSQMHRVTKSNIDSPGI